MCKRAVAIAFRSSTSTGFRLVLLIESNGMKKAKAKARSKSKKGFNLITLTLYELERCADGYYHRDPTRLQQVGIPYKRECCSANTEEFWYIESLVQLDRQRGAASQKSLWHDSLFQLFGDGWLRAASLLQQTSIKDLKKDAPKLFFNKDARVQGEKEVRFAPNRQHQAFKTDKLTRQEREKGRRSNVAN